MSDNVKVALNPTLILRLRTNVQSQNDSARHEFKDLGQSGFRPINDFAKAIKESARFNERPKTETKQAVSVSFSLLHVRQKDPLRDTSGIAVA